MLMDKILTKTTLFVDLDGTIIDTASGRTFPEDILDVKFKRDTCKAIQYLAKSGRLLAVCIVSNQGGIEQGHCIYDSIEAKLSAVANLLEAYLREASSAIDVTYAFCPVNSKDDINRKPNVGMLQTTMGVLHKLHHYETKKCDCMMIGDASGLPGQFSDSDMMTAVNFEIDYMDVDVFTETVLKHMYNEQAGRTN